MLTKICEKYTKEKFSCFDLKKIFLVIAHSKIKFSVPFNLLKLLKSSKTHQNYFFNNYGLLILNL